MAARLIDGLALAQQINDDLRTKVGELAAGGTVPGLAVILVGNDPASIAYVRSKRRTAQALGIESIEHHLEANIAEAKLLELIRRLNDDGLVDGILVQLPLPAHVDAARVIRAIDPQKDVDGFHPNNVGSRVTGAGGVTPCTPMGRWR